MKTIELSREIKQTVLAEIKSYFLKERDEDISDFQAEALLDFLLLKVGHLIYNQAVSDAHQLMSSRVEDLLALEKRPR